MLLPALEFSSHWTWTTYSWEVSLWDCSARSDTALTTPARLGNAEYLSVAHYVGNNHNEARRSWERICQPGMACTAVVTIPESVYFGIGPEEKSGVWEGVHLLVITYNCSMISNFPYLYSPIISGLVTRSHAISYMHLKKIVMPKFGCMWCVTWGVSL